MLPAHIEKHKSERLFLAQSQLMIRWLKYYETEIRAARIPSRIFRSGSPASLHQPSCPPGEDA